MRPPQGYQQPPGRTPVLKPSSNSSLAIASITGSATSPSWYPHLCSAYLVAVCNQKLIALSAQAQVESDIEPDADTDIENDADTDIESNAATEYEPDLETIDIDLEQKALRLKAQFEEEILNEAKIAFEHVENAPVENSKTKDKPKVDLKQKATTFKAKENIYNDRKNYGKESRIGKTKDKPKDDLEGDA